MSVAACLLLYSVAVVVLGPRLLVRLTRAGLAPRLGIAVWLAAISGVVLSWAVTAAFLVGELVRGWNQPGRILRTCCAALRSVALGRYGVFIQIGLLALTTLAAVSLAVLVGSLARSLARTRASTHQHARMARISQVIDPSSANACPTAVSTHATRRHLPSRVEVRPVAGEPPHGSDGALRRRE